MNEKTTSDWPLRSAPLVLRLGLAAILIYGGAQQVMPVFDTESAQSVSADTAGVALAADWSSVIGAAECGIGGLFLLGFLTRLTALGVLGGVGYSAYSAFTSAGEETLQFAAQEFEASRIPLLLLAAACASLLVSGAGCLGFDCRKRKKLAETDAAIA